MQLIDYMKPNKQMRQFIFRKYRWQRLKAAIKRWLAKLIGKSSSH